MKKILLLFACLFCFSSVCVNATSLEETLNSNNNSSDSWETLTFGTQRPNIVQVGSYKDNSFEKFSAGFKNQTKYLNKKTLNSFEYNLGSFTRKYYPAVLLLLIVGWLSWAFKYGKME